MKDRFAALKDFLTKIPAIEGNIGTGNTKEGLWWLKFRIDISKPVAWQVVQEISFVVNNLSVSEKLPTVFFPVSPPPYLNGGPQEFLSWVIECNHSEFSPDDLQEWLAGRLPNPVDDLNQWVGAWVDE
ncbi:hypothetical protein [Pseudobacter ginsenosidimutans]|uniref:Uncharacterized protein n=1 Tax=Pseudobacter ginsenosidimutans TaxID=661488 RepID=A0A4Q7MRY2_9BACT|nr:hypothetical protein [Pseudobacter ginsenosidimutans]QEC42483.1 hypothetical protein FSB84_12550 [Pseudobacter ginsenosidimutans]RZS70664.1 hypothetical protein EV199_2557 [Pseudobacter ginsenosidimutans]